MLTNDIDKICLHSDPHLAPQPLTSSPNKLTSPTTYPVVSLPLPHQPFPPPSSINPTNTHVPSWPAAWPLPLPTCSPAFLSLARPMAFLHTSSLLQHPSPSWQSMPPHRLLFIVSSGQVPCNNYSYVCLTSPSSHPKHPHPTTSPISILPPSYANFISI